VDSGAGLRGLESLERHHQQMGGADALLGKGRGAYDRLSPAADSENAQPASEPVLVPFLHGIQINSASSPPFLLSHRRGVIARSPPPFPALPSNNITPRAEQNTAHVWTSFNHFLYLQPTTTVGAKSTHTQTHTCTHTHVIYIHVYIYTYMFTYIHAYPTILRHSRTKEHTVFSAYTNWHSRLQMPPQNTPSTFLLSLTRSLAHVCFLSSSVNLFLPPSHPPLSLSPSLWRSHGSAMRA
jgi:hypothetical protein